jgi:hypothetical protein
MSITVDIHPDGYRVVLFPAKDDAPPFVVVRAREGDGEVSLFLPDAAACDALFRTGAEAKDKLIQATGAVVRVAADPDACKCGHLGYDHIYGGGEPCTQCDCKAFDAAVPAEPEAGRS